MAEKQTSSMAEAEFLATVSDLMKNYNDKQLKDLLKKHGLDKLPFTAQTKSVLVKKLARKITGFDGDPYSSDNGSRDQPPTGSQSSCDILQSNSGAKTTMNTPNKKLNTAEGEHRLTSSSKDERVTYYAVCIPGPSSTIVIHNSFPDVMKTMKENKGKNPRMLSFNSLKKAEEFASTHTAGEVCEGATIKSVYPQEKAEIESGEVKLFPSLSTPQINQFRVQLERGNLAFAKECIASNPKFLIGTGDMPTIVKEGPRYNALHACVMAGRLESCRLVMETVSNIDYLCRMYTTRKRAEESSLRLIDLYLNTPDKMANKTPLHLASEKGMVEIVAFLVSFKACIRMFARQVPVCKDGEETRSETPEEIVCSRYTKSDAADVRDKILELIRGGTCYVPLIRSDTTGPYAKVGTPYSPTSPYRLVPEIEGAIRQEQYHQQQQQETFSVIDVMPSSMGRSSVTSVPSPHAQPVTKGRNSPVGQHGVQDLRDYRNMRVWAYAGPMSPQEAEDFRREWKCPSKGSNPRENLKILDGDRGFERFGRSLAEEHKTSWQEYWPFLDAFADLRSMEGLTKMETFLLKQRVLLLMQTMASWKGGGIISRKATEEDRVRTSVKGTNKASASMNLNGCGQGRTPGQEMIKKAKYKINQEALSAAPKGESATEGCFLPSAAYKIGQQYVLNPDPVDLDNLSDSFKSPSSLSDDENDKYFSAEGSSDSEEDNDDNGKEKQAGEKKDAFVIRAETTESPGIMGAFWNTVGRLRDYLSPRKGSPVPYPKEGVGKANNSQLEDEITSSESQSSSATSKRLESPEKSHISDNEHTNKTSTVSPHIKPSSEVSSSKVNYETHKNKNINLMNKPEQKKHNNTDTQSLSVKDLSSQRCDTKVRSDVVEEHSNEENEDKSYLSQWKYRNSKVQIFSPESSPSKERGSLLEDFESPREDGERSQLVASSAKSSQNVSADSSKLLQEEAEINKSTSGSALNDSFNIKMDSLCLTLSKFSFQSPTSQSTDSITTISGSSCNLDSSSPTKSVTDISEPSILLFVGKLYPQFLSNLGAHKAGLESHGTDHEQNGVNSLGENQIPTLILHQGQDGEMVVADVFMPSESPLDPSVPVIPEEAHQEIIQSVWVNFIVAFSKSWEARQLCCINEPMVVRTTVVGLMNDADKCWTCSENSHAYKDMQSLFLKCKEEEFVTTQSHTVYMTVVRSSSLPSKDLYVCGSVPTKVDADVYHTMVSQTREAICNEDSQLLLTRLWITQMESRGADGIDSLPSPSRILRSTRRVPPPISPLVKSETPSSNKGHSNPRQVGQFTPGRKVDTLPAKQLFPHGGSKS